MIYLATFANGEKRAWRDRQAGVVRQPPQHIRNEAQRGYWDGYTARNVGWAAQKPLDRPLSPGEAL